jgi:pilus assembly protein Flp/PilA
LHGLTKEAVQVTRSAETEVDQRLLASEPNSRCMPRLAEAFSFSAQHRSGLSRNRSLERVLTMLKHIAKFQVSAFHARTRGERGATAVEYGIMVALIAAVIIALVAAIGGKLQTAFTTVNSKLP